MSVNRDSVIALEFGGQSVKAARVDCTGGLKGPFKYQLTEKPPPGLVEFKRGVTCIVEKARGDHDIEAVGVACPNPYTPEQIIFDLNHKPAYTNVNGNPLRADILKAASCKKLFDINDAAAAVKGELWKGNLPKQGRHVFLTLGTGLGSAFIFNGEIIRGKLGVPASGEIWNFQHRSKDLEKSVGTTKAMVELYKGLGGTDSKIKNGDIKHLADIARNTSDPEYCLARKAFKEFGRSMGYGLGCACSNFGPESFVLSGNIAHAFDLFEKEAASSYFDKKTVFKQSKLIDRNGLLGAAYIAFDGIGTFLNVTPESDQKGNDK